MYSKTVIVRNQIGLKSRPATIFVQKAMEFQSSIHIMHNHGVANAKSLLGVLSRSIDGMEKVEIWAEGPDEEIAVQELCNILENLVEY